VLSLLSTLVLPLLLIPVILLISRLDDDIVPSVSLDYLLTLLFEFYLNFILTSELRLAELFSSTLYASVSDLLFESSYGLSMSLFGFLEALQDLILLA